MVERTNRNICLHVMQKGPTPNALPRQYLSSYLFSYTSRIPAANDCVFTMENHKSRDDVTSNSIANVKAISKQTTRFATSDCFSLSNSKRNSTFDVAVNQFPVVAIIPDDLVGDRRGTCRWETPPIFFPPFPSSPFRSSRFTLIFHLPSPFRPSAFQLAPPPRRT